MKKWKTIFKEIEFTFLSYDYQIKNSTVKKKDSPVENVWEYRIRMEILQFIKYDWALKCWFKLLSPLSMFSFSCQLRLEKLKSSARHEKICLQAWVWGIQVFNFKAGIRLAGMISMLALLRMLMSAYRRSLFITSKKKTTTYNIENKYILQILACPDQIPPFSTGSAAAIA